MRAATALERERPADRAAAAELLGEASAAGRRARFAGGATKLGWGGRGGEAELELSLAGLDRIVEHNAGDLTAVLEAGVPLARAQAAFAEAGQMLALDPPDPGGATLGGVVATADSGPLRARFGAVRDLLVGISVALPDGTLARAGGKVIKNVAGYDLAKLFAGSFGTLGAIVEVSVRLHPRPERTVTAAGGTLDAGVLARGAAALARAPLEPLCLDLRWGGGDGALLARFGGVDPRAGAEAALRLMASSGLAGSLVEEDDEVWQRQRDGQRSPGAPRGVAAGEPSADVGGGVAAEGSSGRLAQGVHSERRAPVGTVVRVSGLPSQLPHVCAAASKLDARLVGRAGLGLSWLRVEERGAEEQVAAVEELRRSLAPAPCVVLDAPPAVRERVDPWGALEPGALELMRRVKERFDPAGTCNPGVGVV